MVGRRVYIAMAGSLAFSGLGAKLLMAGPDTARKLKVTRETVLTTEPPGTAIRPNAIVQSEQGYVVVGGNNKGQGWVAGLDANGEPLWQYTLDKEDPHTVGGGVELKAWQPFQIGRFSCGGLMPRPPRVPETGLVVHLDPNGGLIRKRYIAPQSDSEKQTVWVEVNSCIRWGDNVAILNTVTRWPDARPAGRPASESRKIFNWLVVIDSSGKKTWDMLIPTRLVGINSTASMIIAANSVLVFAANRSDKTEIYQIGADGVVFASAVIDGQYQLVSASTSLAPIRLLGLEGNAAHNRHSNLNLIEFDDNLSIKQRIQSQMIGFQQRGSFGLRDRSILLYGGAFHSAAFADYFTSSVVLLDRNLRTIDELNFPHGQHTFDFGRINAASSGHKNGELSSDGFCLSVAKREAEARLWTS